MNRNKYDLTKPVNQLVSLITAVMMIIIIGCEGTPTEVADYNPEPVLSAFICNGDPVTEVFLERIAPLEGYYTTEANGIVGADMFIFEVGGVDTFYLTDDPDEHGRYIPADGDTLVPQGLALYRIEVMTPPPHNEYIWAETRVPGAVDAHGPVEIVLEDAFGTVYPVSDGDTLHRNMPNMVWHWADVDSAMGFQGITVNLEDRDSLELLDPDFDPDDPDTELEDFEKGRAGYVIMRHDQRSVKIFWLAFQWVGLHRVELLALSQSYYDYLFSLFRVDQGLINEPVSNVHGGLGVFGAVSRYTIDIYMKKVE